MSRYIDADALIDFFSNIQEELGAERISFKSVNRAIDAMATIDVVPKDFHDKTCEAMAKRHTEEIQRLMPKRGKWIPVKASIYPYGNDVKCSFCGHRMGSSFGYNFCPYCGADMRERKESE